MKSRIDGIGIKAISVAVPQKTVNVKDYVKCRSSKNIERVIKHTGIDKIRIAENNITTSDLCLNAAQSFFKGNYNKEDICAIVFISKTPDFFVVPTTSCILQKRMEFSQDILCYDSLAACYGYVAGLQLAGMLSKLHNKDVLLMTGDTNSRIISEFDLSSVMFGDGGSASIIGLQKNNSMSFNIKNDGNISSMTSVAVGGFRVPVTPESFEYKKDDQGNVRQDWQMKMNGLEVANFVVGEVANLIKDTMNEYGGANFFDVYALHQPNEIIIKSLVSCLNIEKEKVPIKVNGYGNISSASIPLTLCSHYVNKDKPDKINALLAGFGSGASWGTVVTNLSETDFYPIQEI